jgi:hypothetical protein
LKLSGERRSAATSRRSWSQHGRHRGLCEFPLNCLRASRVFIRGLKVCETAIHKQFHCPRVTTVVGCEKHHGPGDLIWCEPAKRNTWKSSSTFLAQFCGSQQIAQSGVSMQAHGVPANTAGFNVVQLARRNACRLCGVVHYSPRPFTRDDERLRDDRDAIRHSWQGLLHRKKRRPLKRAALHIFVRPRALGYRADRVHNSLQWPSRRAISSLTFSHLTCQNSRSSTPRFGTSPADRLHSAFVLQNASLNGRRSVSCVQAERG